MGGLEDLLTVTRPPSSLRLSAKLSARRSQIDSGASGSPWMSDGAVFGVRGREKGPVSKFARNT